MSAPLVSIEQGLLLGKEFIDFKCGKFYGFLGIPYGKPPIGELRFKAPQPADSWDDIKDATNHGKECPSLHLMFQFMVGSEEQCLNLNVFTKELPEDKRNAELKPVMVWIHGGAFLLGSNKCDIYGPQYLMTEDIVLVSVNYRVGVLGFLSLEDPSLEVPGNAGLKDIVLALKWIQQNISKFGGNPNNITLFGESAGSACVSYLLLSPLATGLFHKAIMQSGTCLNGWALGSRNALIIAKLLGYKETDEQSILNNLMKESASTLVRAQHKLKDSFEASIVRPFGPVLENVRNELAFLTEKPINILRSGNFNKVPIIIGYNSQEGIFWEFLRKGTKSEVTQDFETEVPYELNLKRTTADSRDVANRIKFHYFGDEEPSEDNLEHTYKMKSDTMFVYGIHRALKYFALHSDQPIYVYKMTLDGPLNYYKKFSFTNLIVPLFTVYYLLSKCYSNKLIKNVLSKISNYIPYRKVEGVCHGDDLGYLFAHFFAPEIDESSLTYTYITRFVKLWTSFAQCGNPTVDFAKNHFWKTWTHVEHNYLDIGAGLVVEKNLDEEAIRFWTEIYNMYDEF